MPVPTWDCPELAMLYDQPVDVTTTNVVSEDIWKKFDLDFPQPVSLDSTGYRYYGGIESGVISDPYERSTTLGIYEKLGSSSPLLSSTSSSTSRIEAREIRHHDCMWAGLCISKEHNRTHPAKKKDVHNNTSKRLAVPAGRSLLINRKQPGSCNTVTATTNNTMNGLIKNLESDGDSTRPETPQSCESESDDEEDEDDDDDDDEEEEQDEEEEEEEDGEEEMPRFKHDSISINEKLSEYVRVGSSAGEIHPSSIVSVSEVTGQQLLPIKINRVNTGRSVKQLNDHTKQMNVKYSRKDEKTKSNKINFYTNNGNGNGNNRQDFQKSTNTVYTQNNNNNNNNCTNIVSLGDHCYHLNQTSSSKKLEHLGVQTPSDSEEEIDVVTFDKPSCRPASLPTNPSLADKQHLQKTVTSALKDKAPPRPRGRPPSSTTSTPRKRTAQSETSTKRPAKKPKQKSTMSYQKRNNNRTNNNNNNNNNQNNNNNNNVDQDNKNNVTERDENCCNSRVSIDTDSGRLDINEETRNGAEIRMRDDNINDRRRSGGDNNCTSHTSTTTTTTTTTTTRVSNVSKESSSNNVTSTSSRSTSSDEEPDTEKRSLHNNMERQRRIELRKAFEDLRVLVPEVQMKEKAPKVVILRQAAIYCDLLTEIGQNTMATVEELKIRQDKLRSKLSQLRRNFRTERTGAEVRNSNHHHNRRARRGSGLQG